MRKLLPAEYIYRHDVNGDGVLQTKTHNQYPHLKMAIQYWQCILLTVFATIITKSFGLKLHEDIFCTCTKQPYPHRPFTAIWNSPTGGCNANFSVPINLKDWDILADPLQHWDSRFVTVFYGAQLGLYPYFKTEDGSDSFNQGLPQVNLIICFVDFTVGSHAWVCCQFVDSLATLSKTDFDEILFVFFK